MSVSSVLISAILQLSAPKRSPKVFWNCPCSPQCQSYRMSKTTHNGYTAHSYVYNLGVDMVQRASTQSEGMLAPRNDQNGTNP